MKRNGSGWTLSIDGRDYECKDLAEVEAALNRHGMCPLDVTLNLQDAMTSALTQYGRGNYSLNHATAAGRDRKARR